jgi:hypothetical protein
MIHFNDIYNMKDVVSNRIFKENCSRLTDEQLLVVKQEMLDHGLE